MTRWKFIFLLSACILGMVSTGKTETTLVIVTGEIPPMISEQLDQSFLTAVFRVVEQEMGVKFVFRFVPWKRCEEAIEELSAWGAIPYVHTPEREKKFDFSNRLFNTASELFGYSADGKRKVFSYTILDELKHYRIGGVIGYWYVQKFHEAGIDLELVATEEQNIKKLQIGRIDFTPIDVTAGWYFINRLFPKERDKFFTLAPPLLVKDSFLMTSKQYPETQRLLSDFNAAMQKIKDNGMFQQLMKKYGVMCTP